jgi:hypothetical protein
VAVKLLIDEDGVEKSGDEYQWPVPEYVGLRLQLIIGIWWRGERKLRRERRRQGRRKDAGLNSERVMTGWRVFEEIKLRFLIPEARSCGQS